MLLILPCVLIVGCVRVLLSQRYLTTLHFLSVKRMMASRVYCAKQSAIGQRRQTNCGVMCEICRKTRSRVQSRRALDQLTAIDSRSNINSWGRSDTPRGCPRSRGVWRANWMCLNRVLLTKAKPHPPPTRAPNIVAGSSFKFKFIRRLRRLPFFFKRNSDGCAWSNAFVN